MVFLNKKIVCPKKVSMHHPSRYDPKKRHQLSNWLHRTHRGFHVLPDDCCNAIQIWMERSKEEHLVRIARVVSLTQLHWIKLGWRTEIARQLRDMRAAIDLHLRFPGYNL